jgi:hypothetical protein
MENNIDYDDQDDLFLEKEGLNFGNPGAIAKSKS